MASRQLVKPGGQIVTKYLHLVLKLRKNYIYINKTGKDWAGVDLLCNPNRGFKPGT